MTSSPAIGIGAGSVPLFGPASGPFDVAEAVLDAVPAAAPLLIVSGPSTEPAAVPAIVEQPESIREMQARVSLDPDAMIDHRSRIVAYSDDRVSWIRARSRGITATDVAKLTSETAVRSVLWEKLNGSGFGGNAYTEHGRRREPVIARWVFDEHGIAASNALFHAFEAPQHLATPDGVAARGTGTVELAEIKTTSKPWRSIPRGYLRQIWWQQYVLGAERTLLVWEQHKDFRVIDEVPQCRWIERDDAQIATLIRYAEMVLDGLEVARSRGY